MRITIISIVFTALLITTNSVKLVEIEQRYQATHQKRSTIPLPQILKDPSLPQQMLQYEQTHNSQQFLNFTSDPELSSHILLKRQGSKSQSLWFQGLQLHNLLLQISVIHLANPNHDLKAISVYLIDWSSGQFLLTKKIKQANIFKIEVVSQLYQLRVSYDWDDSDQQATKHVAIGMQMDPIKSEGARKDDGAVAVQKLKKIKDETDRVYVESLQIWDEIRDHHTEFYTSQEAVYSRALMELICLFVINCIEIIMLRRTLKTKVFI